MGSKDLLSSVVALVSMVSLSAGSAAIAANQSSSGADVTSDPHAIVGGDRSKGRQSYAIVGGDDPHAIVGGDRATAGSAELDEFAVKSAVARGLLVYGPIDSVNTEAGTIIVAGQQFATRLAADRLDQLSGRLEAGESVVVAVFGTNRQGGALLPHSMIITPVRYIPGSTAIVIVGKPQNVDPSIGRLTVGRLLVDYASATVKSSCSDISAASRVIVIGVRHGVDSSLIATRVMPKDDCQ